MQKEYSKSLISGEIIAPPSKSFMQRVLCASMLCTETSTIKNIDKSNDSLNALNLISKLGAKVEKKNNKLQIKGGISINENNLFIGESGLGFRMFAPVVSLLNQKITLSGHGSLLRRPMNMLIEALQNAGVEVNSESGYIPLEIKGPLKGGEIFIDGSTSSQVLTGFLMALPLAQKNSIIYVKNLKSKPYIDLTISVLNHFGIEIKNENYETFLTSGNQVYKPVDIDCESDWSSAAFMIAAGAIGGKTIVKNLNFNSKQADIAILEVLKKSKCKFEIENDTLITYKSELEGFEFDATDCPDLFPILSIYASHCKGTTKIIGTERLTHKESNRAIVIQNEFSKLGIKIDLKDNEMIIEQSKIIGGEIDSNNDHRIAMSAAIASINATNPVIINDIDCIKKSYPDFITDFENIRNPYNKNTFL